MPLLSDDLVFAEYHKAFLHQRETIVMVCNEQLLIPHPLKCHSIYAPPL